MRKGHLLIFGALLLSAAGLRAQHKTFDWVPQNAGTYSIGPGYHSGVAVYAPHGREALHVRLEIAARQPVSVGVVRLEDWNRAVRNPQRLEHLDYACLTQGVTRINFSCNFYPSDLARVVVVSDSRGTERPIVSGVAAPFVRSDLNQMFVNDVHVTPYNWECVSGCDLPDPPQFDWVELEREKYRLTPGVRFYGPFIPAADDGRIRIQVRSQLAVTVAVVAASEAAELDAHSGRTREILSRSACREYAVHSTTLDCAFHKDDGPVRVVLLPESEINKNATGNKKQAEIAISAVQCVAHCEK
jgi:hypothetical protein